MKVFLSWSGSQSNEIAIILRNWLKQVIHKVDPYVSSEDIAKGARWSSDIAKELEFSQFGIICITRETMDAPWINFEAGALSKTVDKSRVCPVLFDLDCSELQGRPLLQFMCTTFDKDDFYKVVCTLNSCLGAECLESTVLEKSFEMWWPSLEKEIQSVLPFQPTLNFEINGMQQAPLKDHMILEELLTLARDQQKILTSQERMFAPLTHKVFFDDLKKFENSLSVSKTVSHLISFIDKANLQLQEIVNNSQIDGIEKLQEKFAAIVATAKYLETQLPQKSHQN